MNSLALLHCSVVPLKWAWLFFMDICTPVRSLISCTVPPFLPIISPTLSLGIGIRTSSPLRERDLLPLLVFREYDMTVKKRQMKFTIKFINEIIRLE